MNTTKLKETLSLRLSLNDNDDFALMECWKQERNLLSEDISGTIVFFDSCTDEEFYWLSEVFDDLIEKTQSKELFQTICARTERVSDPELKASIATDIEFARERFENNNR